MRHLTRSDYTAQPWKNGKGSTLELWRLEQDGQVQVRLSIAAVTEDGPFSLFPGIERNLTVLSGPGFRLTGPGVDLVCAPLVPVAFAGDVAVVASGTAAGPSTDFNVMTARDRPCPLVRLAADESLPPHAAGQAVLALGPARVNGRALAAKDLILTGTGLEIGAEPVLLVRF